MPAGYVIAQLKITNPENYKEYVEKVTPLVKKFDGEFLVRAGEFQIFDGETKFPRIIVLKFPSYEKALECHKSKEYQAGWSLAKNTTKRHMQIVEGFSTE